MNLPDPDTITWTVVNQQPTSGLGPAGNHVPGTAVTVRLTGTNTIFQVFVPADMYDADTVRRMILDRAVHFAAVDASTGQKG